VLAIAEVARQKLQAERKGEEALRERKRAWEVGDRFLTRVSEHLLTKQPGTDKLRKALMKEAASFYEDFLREDSKYPEMRAERGRVLMRYAWLVTQAGAGAAGPGTRPRVVLAPEHSAGTQDPPGLRPFPFAARLSAAG
jgi:hypothetical protein